MFRDYRNNQTEDHPAEDKEDYLNGLLESYEDQWDDEDLEELV